MRSDSNSSVNILKGTWTIDCIIYRLDGHRAALIATAPSVCYVETVQVKDDIRTGDDNTSRFPKSIVDIRGRDNGIRQNICRPRGAQVLTACYRYWRKLTQSRGRLLLCQLSSLMGTRKWPKECKAYQEHRYYKFDQVLPEAGGDSRSIDCLTFSWLRTRLLQ